MGVIIGGCVGIACDVVGGAFEKNPLPAVVFSSQRARPPENSQQSIWHSQQTL